MQMRTRLLLALAPLALLSACGSLPPSDSAADIAELTRLSVAWDSAIVHKDRSAIEGNMADDFRQIGGNGDVEDKASFVAGLLDPVLEIDPYTVEDFDVRLYGDIALLSGRSHLTGRYAGKGFVTQYRYIDIYARRDGRWRVISVQISKIPA